MLFDAHEAGLWIDVSAAKRGKDRHRPPAWQEVVLAAHGQARAGPRVRAVRVARGRRRQAPAVVLAIEAVGECEEVIHRCVEISNRVFRAVVEDK